MEPQAPPPPSKRTPVWPVVALILLAIGGFVAWRVLQQPRGSTEAAAVVDAGAPVVEVDAGPTVELSMDDGDALLKKLAAPWSGEPTYSLWLAAMSLRHLVAATALVAEGGSPRPALPFVSIAAPFTVREEEGPPIVQVKKGKKPPPPREVRAFMSVQSTARYDGLTKIFGSIDAARAGDAFSQLAPYCDLVFAEISRPGTRFHDSLVRAVKRVLAVKVPEGDIELVPKGAIYLFQDPAIEALSPAEKHLVRMGAANAKVAQDQVRVFASHARLEP